jgi:ferredoxin-nitrate reductase
MGKKLNGQVVNTENEDLNALVCHCRQVKRERLERAANFGMLDLQQIIIRTLAGSGCGSCRPSILKIINKRKQR